MQILIGIIFDKYTPNVEAMMTRDFMGIINMFYRDQVVACCKQASKIERALGALNIRVCQDTSNCEDFLIYKVTENWPQVPDNCTNPMQRDLYVPKADFSMKSDPTDTGYYLPQWGRPYISDINRLQYRPNAIGEPDPAIRLLWG